MVALDSYENWILLCANHHRLVDAQPDLHTATLLREWKTNHERLIAKRLEFTAQHRRPTDERPHAIEFDGLAYRVGRSEFDQWTFDRRSGRGRFDDPFGSFPVVYGATSERGALFEAMGLFRPGPALLTQLAAIEVDTEHDLLGAPEADRLSDVGRVPAAWLSRVSLSEAWVSARLADLRDADTIAYVQELVRPSLGDVSPEELVYSRAFRVTQEVARRLAEQQDRGVAVFDGVIYPSRADPDASNIALWRATEITQLRGSALDPTDPQIRAVAASLDMQLPGDETCGSADAPSSRSSAVTLVVGARRVDRRIPNAVDLLLSYRTDDGLRYLDYQPISGPDTLVPDDLAVTILINSRASSTAFKSVQDRGLKLDLRSLPDKALEDTTPEERDRIAAVIAEMASWPGIAASVATKVLHKKRPSLIPILDNRAIFGAYMNPRWPGQPSSRDSVRALTLIRDGLEWIAADLTRPENVDGWRAFAELEPTRSRIDHFDMVWWMYFRGLEPVHRAASE